MSGELVGPFPAAGENEYVGKLPAPAARAARTLGQPRALGSLGAWRPVVGRVQITGTNYGPKPLAGTLIPFPYFD